MTSTAPASTAASTASAASAASTPSLRRERALVESVVIHRSAGERKAGSVLSLRSHAAATKALRKHGLCIIPAYFSKPLIAEGGQCAVVDVQETIERLEHSTVGMQLTPSPPKDVDYEEYASRDAQFVRGHDDKYTLKRGKRLQQYADQHSELLRHNACVLKVIEQVVLPTFHTKGGGSSGSSGCSGSSGSSKGSSSAETSTPTTVQEQKERQEERKTHTMLRRSSSLLESHPVGAVVAMPGRGVTKDQTIHVDTEHLYEHLHLPPHYVVMFLPSLATREELMDAVGQTAFVCGSHVSQVARGIAKDGKERAHQQRWSLENIVRPHCEAGDVVLFDARIMHFGIANRSLQVWRPLLFVNYTRPWFSDYQPGGEVIVRHR